MKSMTLPTWWRTCSAHAQRSGRIDCARRRGWLPCCASIATGWPDRGMRLCRAHGWKLSPVARDAASVPAIQESARRLDDLESARFADFANAWCSAAADQGSDRSSGKPQSVGRIGTRLQPHACRRAYRPRCWRVVSGRTASTRLPAARPSAAWNQLAMILQWNARPVLRTSPERKLRGLCRAGCHGRLVRPCCDHWRTSRQCHRVGNLFSLLAATRDLRREFRFAPLRR